MTVRSTAATTLATDVLVVGGGLAALRAAWSARQAGARVLVMVKRKLGQSGSSANTSGGFAAASPALDPADDARQHYADTVVGGGFVNERPLARALAEEAPARLQELIEVGARFQQRNGHYYLSPSGDHRHPRVLVPEHVRGTDLTLPLRAAVLASGVDVVENVLVVELLVDDGRVVGALGIRRDRAELVVVQAGATILAAGGAGRLFSVTSNPVDVTGGGYALALQAGATLRDMEFIQFYPWRCIRPFGSSRVPVQPSTFVSGREALQRRRRALHGGLRPGPEGSGDARRVRARHLRPDSLRESGGRGRGARRLGGSRRRVPPREQQGGGAPRSARDRLPRDPAHHRAGGPLRHGRRADRRGGRGEPPRPLRVRRDRGRGPRGQSPEQQRGARDPGLRASRRPGRRPLRRRGRRPARSTSGPSRGGRAGSRRSATRARRSRRSSRRRWPRSATRCGSGWGSFAPRPGSRRPPRRPRRPRPSSASCAPRPSASWWRRPSSATSPVAARASAASALFRTESRAAHYREDHPETDPAWVATVTYANDRASRRPLAVDRDEVGRLGRPTDRPPGADEFVE